MRKLLKQKNSTDYYAQILFELIFLFLSIGFAFIVVMKIVPNDTALNPIVNETYTYARFLPEHHEMRRYLLYIILIALFSLLGRFFSSRMKPKSILFSQKQFALVISSCFTIVLIVLINSMLKNYVDESTNFNFNLYYIGLFAQFSLYVAIPFLILFTVFYIMIPHPRLGGLCRKLFDQIKKYKWLSIGLDIFVLITIAFVIKYMYSLHYLTNSAVAVHWEAIFDPIVGVDQGIILSGDHGRRSLYGLYPYFLAPLQNLFFGKVSIEATLYLFLALTAISLFFLYQGCKNLFSNKLIALIIFFTITYLCHIWFVTYVSFFLFQYSLRTFFPYLGFMIASIYVKKPNESKYFVIFIIISTIAVIFNFESGIVLLIASCILSVFCRTQGKSWNTLAFWKKTGKTLLYEIGLISAVFFLFQLCIFLKFKEFSSLKSMTWGGMTFGREGFGMLPLPPLSDGFHPYMIVLAIYSFALFHFIFRCSALGGHQKDSYSLLIMPFLSVLGFGLFSTYLGRTVVTALFPCIWPAFLLVGIYADTLKTFETTLLKPANYSIKAIRGVILGFFVLGTISIFTMQKTDEYQHYMEFKTGSAQIIGEEKSLIIPENKEAHNAFISCFGSILANHYEIDNEFKNTTYINSFFQYDFREIYDFINQYQGTIFIDSRAYADLQSSRIFLRQDELLVYHGIVQLLDDKYVLKAENDFMRCYTRNR